VALFHELAPAHVVLAGGKGASLIRLARAGLPVPPGLVILPGAFDGRALTEDAWSLVRARLRHVRGSGPLRVAVRSSAHGEDSEAASFAGAFDTVLDVRTEADLRAAIDGVYGSRLSERALAYARARGVTQPPAMAVVVQRLALAELAGVLFTADPLTGSFNNLVGRFVEGLGERLVSGEDTGQAFVLRRPGGAYQGPRELAGAARRLYALACQVERDFGDPQDIEWAVEKGKVILLQSRPITTLRVEDPCTAEHNDSVRGDFLWTSNNGGEAVPDVMTPLTWSTVEIDLPAFLPFPAIPHCPIVSNVGGRMYINASVRIALLRMTGMSEAEARSTAREALGNIPADLEVPPIPLSRWQLLGHVMLGVLRQLPRIRRDKKEVPEFLVRNPRVTRELRRKIPTLSDARELVYLWDARIVPLRVDSACKMIAVTMDFMDQVPKLRKVLHGLVGEADADKLLGAFGAGGQLSSLGPLLGLAKVWQGTMSRDDYLEEHGHRGAHEAELALPRPAEDPAWLDHQLAEFQKSRVSPEALLAKNEAARTAALARLSQGHPRRAKGIAKALAKIETLAIGRENLRSELIRVSWVTRVFAVQAGALTGLGDRIFFLRIPEVLDVLRGDRQAVEHIPARQEVHRRLSALPEYPLFIRGKFDPMAWAADPNRRTDIYDGSPRPRKERSASELYGCPGVAGTVEGVVRRLLSFEEAHQLQPGEILVAKSTNIGWTPYFPRALAIITDVGAPLSHAVIVARELGIPAVVGCGDATERLPTGTRVRVHGAEGRVEILAPAEDRDTPRSESVA
jgi:pyruvate,water dikinase